MIKLFSLKNQQQNEANKGNTGGKRASAAQLRVQKGLLSDYTIVLSFNKFFQMVTFTFKFI